MFATTAAGLYRREYRDLDSLIRIYEGNYFRLMRLAPELSDLEGTTVSRVAGALDLYLTIIERAPYTTFAVLTYRFDDGLHSLAEPNARIAVYHDVRAVEVLSHCRRRRASRAMRWSPGHMPELDRRWEMNRFLQKWLGFCQHQGHLFLRCTTQQVG